MRCRRNHRLGGAKRECEGCRANQPTRAYVISLSTTLANITRHAGIGEIVFIINKRGKILRAEI